MAESKTRQDTQVKLLLTEQKEMEMAESRFFKGDVSAPRALDDKGRCCGRKPLTYKREGHRFCDRCNRSYHYYQDFQIDNWAWKRRADGQFEYMTGRTRIGR